MCVRCVSSLDVCGFHGGQLLHPPCCGHDIDRQLAGCITTRALSRAMWLALKPELNAIRRGCSSMLWSDHEI